MLALAVFALIGVAQGLSNSRIAGGGQMPANEHPYLGVLTIFQSNQDWPICGCVLVRPNKAVTTARCLGDTQATYRVGLGVHSLSQDMNLGMMISVSSIAVHPQYQGNAVGFPNDIAVMTLAVNADTSSPTISPIDLIASGTDVTGQNCTISGWGSTTSSGSHQDYPLKATFPAISLATCQSRWSDAAWGDALPGHVCMDGALGKGQSACHMDQGGPMTCEDGTLAGVISWGEGGCNGTAHPTVMSSIAYYHDWISQHL